MMCRHPRRHARDPSHGSCQSARPLADDRPMAASRAPRRMLVPRRTGRAEARHAEEAPILTLVTIAVGAVFAVIGAAAERLASVWPPGRGAADGHPGRAPSCSRRSAAQAAPAIAARSTLPWWATAMYLVLLALMVVLTATDLEQRRLPHLVLDPLIVLALLFVPFNPAVAPLDAAPRRRRPRSPSWARWRSSSAVGWPSATCTSSRPSASCSAGRRSSPPSSPRRSWRPARASCCSPPGGSGMRSYIPFGPFLVGRRRARAPDRRPRPLRRALSATDSTDQARAGTLRARCTRLSSAGAVT